MMTDTLADMLTRIRNASRLGQEVVVMPGSKLKMGLAEALKREGFIHDFKMAAVPGKVGQEQLTLMLRYGPDGERVIQFIDRVSKPGRRIYAGVQNLPKVLNGMGCTILSTSSGILSDREARQRRVGGEILCRVG